jgi:disulfide bond formation protein DsbB
MTDPSVEIVASRLLGLANLLFALLAMATLAGILTVAMTLQYANGELPCPLCLLQRVAMFGVCFGIMLEFRNGASSRGIGCSLVFVILLLIVSIRQTLLDIYPRPGHEYIGSAVLGLHMPVWSIIIALALLSAYAARLALLGGGDPRGYALADFSRLQKIANLLSLYVIALCLINLVSVVLQCGLGQCHTFGYVLLQ